MQKQHFMDIDSALEISINPSQYHTELVYAASTIVANAYRNLKKPQEADSDLEIAKLKKAAARAYVAIYKGETEHDLHALEKLAKYLSTMNNLYSKLYEATGPSMPEAGLIAKLVKRDFDIVENIILRQKSVHA